MSEAEIARYEAIAEHLMGLIKSSQPGDRLPSEAELCDQFGVSRMTARHAVQLIAREGLIERRRGAGTFVRTQPVLRQLGSPLSFSENMRARDMEPSSQSLSSELRAASEDEARALRLDGGADIYVLERLRLADATPMAIERVAMRPELAQELPAGFETGSLHDAFRSIDRHPAESHSNIAARRARLRERDLLELPTSGLVIEETRTIFDQSHEPLERTTTAYAAERYTFQAVLIRDPGLT